MPKHKQSKRERKFAAKGGVKASLEKGGSITNKGKVKRKRRTPKHSGDGDDSGSNKHSKFQQPSYTQQQEAKRNAEDFTSEENLAHMNVSDFFASLEDDLKHPELMMSDDDDDSDSDSEDSNAEVFGTSSSKKESKKKAETAKQKKGKEESSDHDSSSSSSDEDDKIASTKNNKSKDKKPPNDKDSDSDSSSSSSDESDEEQASPKKKAKLEAATTSNETKKKKKKSTKEISSDSDSEDEDIEAAEARMKAEMKKLQSQDPEFHEFLKENEDSLLEFGGEDGEDDDDSDDSDSDDDDNAKASKKKKKTKNNDVDDDDKEKSNSIELTPKMLHRLEHGAFVAYGLKSLRKMVKAYRSACQVASESSGDDKKKKAKKNPEEKQFRIESSEVFDKLMITCLGRCHEAFYFHLLASDEEREAATKTEKKTKTNKTKEKADKPDTKKTKSSKKKQEDDSDSDASSADPDADEEMEEAEKQGDTKDAQEDEEGDPDERPLDPRVLEKSPRWGEVKGILSSFLRSTLELISESKEPDLLTIVLKALSKYVRYMTPFPRIAEVFLKTLVSLWSAPLGDASAEYQVVRLNAFLRIRQLALTQPFPFVELCLKKTYLAYARRARFSGTASSVMTNSLPTFTFMGNCLVELYMLDQHSSYQHAFVYIRQLALFLRAVLQKKQPEDFQQVYCWQYLHCLKLWVAVLSAACKQSTGEAGSGDDQMLRSLVYPLTEIIFGTIKLAPAPSRHVPLRFHCVRLLQQLAAASEKYIPTTQVLLSVMDFPQFDKRPKMIRTKGGGATTRGVQLPFLLKLAKVDPLRTAEEQEACIAEVFKLLNREIDLYRYSAGFPEFSIVIVTRLKKFMKAPNQNPRWRTYARGTLELIDRYTAFAVKARSKLQEAPKDVKRLECLRGPNDPSMGERYDAAVERENKEWSSLISATSAMMAKKAKEGEKDELGESGDEEEETAETDKKKKDKKRKNKKRKEPSSTAAPAPPKVDKAVMAIKDDVKEGIDWSSDEE